MVLKSPNGQGAVPCQFRIRPGPLAIKSKNLLGCFVHLKSTLNPKHKVRSTGAGLRKPSYH